MFDVKPVKAEKLDKLVHSGEYRQEQNIDNNLIKLDKKRNKIEIETIPQMIMDRAPDHDINAQKAEVGNLSHKINTLNE